MDRSMSTYRMRRWPATRGRGKDEDARGPPRGGRVAGTASRRLNGRDATHSGWRAKRRAQGAVGREPSSLTRGSPAAYLRRRWSSRLFPMEPPRAIATVASAICRRPVAALLVLLIALAPLLVAAGRVRPNNSLDAWFVE